MTNVVSICNLALAHLGDDATLSSIDPPEGSAQADHCAQFYPIARDALLEMHPWKFAMRRATLAPKAERPYASWGWAYALPSDAVQVFKVSGPEDMDDQGDGYSSAFYPVNNLNRMRGSQDFEIEADENGAPILYTNQAQASIRYTAAVENAARFPPLFVTALSYQLAAFLAGPVLKGETGRTVAAQMLQLMRAYLSPATVSDARQRRADRVLESQVAPWMANR